MKKIARVFSTALALSLFLSACNTGGTTTTDGSQPVSETTASTSGDDVDPTNGTTNGGTTDGTTSSEGEEWTGARHQDPKFYTYTEAWAAGPNTTWSPHAWEMDTESGLMELIDTGFVNPVYDVETDGWAWKFEAATEINDITGSFEDKEKFGVPEDATEQYVYEIKLNPDVVWEDGTPINADSYMYSMKELLNPEMKNYRANTYYTGSLGLANGQAYYNNDKAGDTLYSPVITEEGDQSEGKTLLFSVEQVVPFFNNSSAKSYYDGGSADSFKVDGEDLYAKYAESGYVEVTEEVQADLTKIAVSFGDENPDAWKEFTVFEDGVVPETPFEDVGLIKVDDHTLIYVLQNALSQFHFQINMGSATWLVDEELYEGGKEQIEDLVATNYFTDQATTKSYGPYKMVSYEKDRQIVLERNENWHGYKTDDYDDEWQFDAIRIEIIKDHNTRLQMFLQGNLDVVSLESADMETYRFSNYLLSTDQTFTNRWIFNSDPESLVKLEQEAGDGGNKQVLQYDDFRKALSLSIDRGRFVEEGTAAYSPAYFLLNYLYYYNIENDPESVYRTSDAGMKAILDLYEIPYDDNSNLLELFNSISGYDETEAKALFTSVYETAIEEGTYTDGQDILLNVMATGADALSADLTKQQDLLQDFINAATAGTGFESKIKLNFQFGSSTRYADVAAGRIESIMGAWGGAAFYPFSTIRVYTEPDYMGGLESIHESGGWDPTTDELTIAYDFDGDGTEEEVTDTFQNWAKSINGSGEHANDPEASLAVLAGIERGVLNTYQSIPLATQTSSSLRSMRMEYATYNYDIMYGYGGYRQYEMTMDDTEWKAFIQEQGGTLNYE